jgi:hypothetical protein
VRLLVAIPADLPGTALHVSLESEMALNIATAGLSKLRNAEHTINPQTAAAAAAASRLHARVNRIIRCCN